MMSTPSEITTYTSNYVGDYQWGQAYIEVSFYTDLETQSETSAKVYKRVRIITTSGTVGTSIGWTIAEGSSEFDGVSLNSPPVGVKYDSGWGSGETVNYGSSVSVPYKYFVMGGSTASISQKSYSPVTPRLTPNAPTNVTHVRNSDTSNTISWTNNATLARPYDGFQIMRSTDNGASFSSISVASPSATSYVDTSCTPNESYRYKIRAYNGSGDSRQYSPFSALTAATYNTPSIPLSITGARSTGTTAVFTIQNMAKTASSLELQQSTDGSTWSTVATFNGSPVTSCEYDNGGGQYYYRCRNKVGDLASGWSPTSNLVITKAPPSPPELVSPAGNSYVGVAYGEQSAEITFKWIHNPVDGSSQTAARLQWSKDNGTTWTTVNISGSSQEKTETISVAANDVIKWKVCTKGEHEDYGQYSSVSQFTIGVIPSLEITTASPVTNMPLTIAYTATGASVVAATARILLSGSEVYSIDMGSSSSVTIGTDDFLPKNGYTYTLSIEARTAVGIQATATKQLAISYYDVVDGVLSIAYNEQTGAVDMVVTWPEPSQGKSAGVSASVVRVYNGERVILASGLASGASITDTLAPLCVDYSYEVCVFAQTNIYSEKEYAAHFKTRNFYFLYNGSVAKACWNPVQKTRINHPSRQYVHHWGQRLPSSYDMMHRADERTLDFAVMDSAQMRDFLALSDYGRAVYKNRSGEVFNCDVECEFERSYNDKTCWGTCSASIVRTA